jgi:N-acetylglucosamine-6-phosphate deacetylase
MQFVARRYDTKELVRCQLQQGEITGLVPLLGQNPGSPSPSSIPWVAPGLVDLQINGYGGRELTDPAVTPEHVRQISLALDRDGVTSFCPTVTTQSQQLLLHSLTTIAESYEQFPEVQARVAGIHLEGPYIGREDGPRGAHPLAHCRPPDWEEFQQLQEAAQGLIRLVTLSPEYDESVDFIRRAVEGGILVAIGHTAASPEQIRQAVDAGARLSTHLGNGAHGQIRRHPNYIWEQLAEDRLTASLIVDGHHLPASVVQSFVRAKTPERCILVSDITGLGGMPPGRYETSLGAVEILEDGRLVIAGQRQLLAGAALPMTVAVPNVMRFAQVSLRQAMEMASVRPAQLIGIPPARLEIGSQADLILFQLAHDAAHTSPMEIVATIKQGVVTFGEIPAQSKVPASEA